MTHEQAKEVFEALTKDGDPNPTLSFQWAIFRLTLETGGDALYTKITGKPVSTPPAAQAHPTSAKVPG